jgi:hypothetical protein
MNLHKLSNGLSFFAIGAVALLAAFNTGRYVTQQADSSLGNSPFDGQERVSFNDGTQNPCPEIEITAYANKRDVADALQQGAETVSVSGCVNFIFAE